MGDIPSWILFLGAQTVAVLVWLVRLGSRVEVAEKQVAYLTIEISRIDHEGTRRLGVLEERQHQMAMHLKLEDNNT